MIFDAFRPLPRIELILLQICLLPRALAAPRPRLTARAFGKNQGAGACPPLVIPYNFLWKKK